MQETQQAVLHSGGEGEHTAFQNVMTLIRLDELSWMTQFEGVQTNVESGALIDNLDVMTSLDCWSVPAYAPPTKHTNHKTN